MSNHTGDLVSVKIIPNDKGNPPGKLADAEVIFEADAGPLSGLKLIGFSVWERRDGGRNVTFPARQYSVNGERRSFALLRPSSFETSSDPQTRIRNLIVDAYERHIALQPKQTDVRAAKLMVDAYGPTGLNELKKAVSAKQIVTAAEDPPTSNQFAQLAQLAYQAGETRVGDLAAARAVDRAPPDKRKELRQAFELLKSSGQQGIPEPTTTPSS